MKTQHYLIIGQVQGVGFRPFVYRLATSKQLAGWVKNQFGQVEIIAQGSPENLATFYDELLNKAPSRAKPQIALSESVKMATLTGFKILPSDRTEPAIIHIPPDYAPCLDCLTEFDDPADRRYQYPFINCTQCGPRFTIISRLPYDRLNTSMSAFPLCPDCQAEYENPSDRRFHAEPVACPQCGPVLEFHSLPRHTGFATLPSQLPTSEAALLDCVSAFHAGEIVAVKGIGGYHLMCDAGNDEAIHHLRRLKPRPDKPLAVLFPDDEILLNSNVVLEEHHTRLLREPMRPIVLVSLSSKSREPSMNNRSTENVRVSTQIAPGLTEIGIMLPSNPLHVLLVEAFGGPLVATSANISGEPILTAAAEVEKRLGHIAQHCLHHNRPIVRPADDSVFRFIQRKPRPIRLGRGSAPVELTLPVELAQPTLAVGGHQKNTVALGWKNRVVISAHIGDLGSPRSQAVFEQVISDLQRLYDMKAERIICDVHSHYSSSRWAKKTGLPVYQVYHHHAHAAAVVGEFYGQCSPTPSSLKEANDKSQSPRRRGLRNVSDAWLVFTWDGVGLGEEGQLWGGEALYGWPGQWQRVGTFRSFAPPGGDKAGREPWRSALAVSWEIGYQWKGAEKIADIDLLYQAWQKQINCPRTSAVGRLFDAAAALTGLVYTASFEGQAPMRLEAACQDEPVLSGVKPVFKDSLSNWNGKMPIDLPIRRNSEGIWQIDWEPLIPMLIDTRQSVSVRAACFHASLAHSLQNLAHRIRDEYGVTQIGLAGGVFQNRVLSEQVFSWLSAEGFEVVMGTQLPANDAGLSFGQIVEAAAMDGSNEVCR